MKSTFLPKYEPNIVRISALYCATLHTGQKFFLVHMYYAWYYGETMTSQIQLIFTNFIAFIFLNKQKNPASFWMIQKTCDQFFVKPRYFQISRIFDET